MQIKWAIIVVPRKILSPKIRFKFWMHCNQHFWLKSDFDLKVSLMQFWGQNFAKNFFNRRTLNLILLQPHHKPGKSIDCHWLERVILTAYKPLRWRTGMRPFTRISKSTVWKSIWGTVTFHRLNKLYKFIYQMSSL